jgi:primosomal protein N' (replication factor Y) (superfamily II helicase)
MLIAELALPVPLGHTFTYRVPDALANEAALGKRCVCPFRSKKLIGVITSLRDEAEPPARTRNLEQILGEPSLPEELLTFLIEISRYYFVPLGEVVKVALPPVDRETNEAIRELSLFPERASGVTKRNVQWVSALAETKTADAKLTARQTAVLAHIRGIGSTSIARLEETWKSSRPIVQRLEALGLVSVTERERPEDPFFREEIARIAAPSPTLDQIRAHDAITESLDLKKAQTFLLRGVTGSGKTEVYFRAIEETKKRGLGTLVLVPEIALTPQLVERFRARFGDDVAVLHSGLTPKERLSMWHLLRKQTVDVVIGARSALFAPIANLGLVVVDEEHDPSFKQEEGVRYHARDMAILRAHRANAVIVLGSATPSLEAEHMVRTQKARALDLPSRARSQAMPSVEIIDLKHIGAGPTGDKRISITLHRAIEQTLAKQEQAILFLNRRGFSPSARCEACGALAECPNCSVALTFHKKRGATLRCHYCEYEVPMLANCLSCSSEKIALEGIGTEKLEDTLTQAFPTARIARLDRDVASGKDVARILTKMRAREIDILVGTQMVTKGHDLPLVTLVGVINADAALSIPDFRASERAFHLLVQVAGRAGRGDAPGRVLIQTYDPKHPAIVSAIHHDVPGFTETELAARLELNYPPYTRVVLVRVDGPDEIEVSKLAGSLANLARSLNQTSVDISGPSPAPLARLRNRFRFRFLLRSADRKALRLCAKTVLNALQNLPRHVRVVVDVDPVQFL